MLRVFVRNGYNLPRTPHSAEKSFSPASPK